MKVSKYNINLHRINENHLEMIRGWRNSDYVNSRMIYKDYITEEMQKKWYDTINNNQNYYFVAEYNNDFVGVMHVKNIVNNAGEGGIYLASDKFENTDVVARMILCFNDFIFDELNLSYIYSQVQADNTKALSSSKSQGCIVDTVKSTKEITAFVLLPENYKSRTIKIKNILSR